MTSYRDSTSAPPERSLRARISDVNREFGPVGVAAISWSRLWMSLAGVPLLGRLAVRLAAFTCPPFYGRHRLARYHSHGFVAPGARLTRSGLKRGRNIFVGDDVVILRDTGGGPVTLGDRVHLNEGVRIVTAHGGSVSVGDDTHVQPGCYFMAVHQSVLVGCKVQIAPNCAFYPYEHGTGAELPLHEQPLHSKGDIEIADDVWLGFGVVVLSGVSIGAGTVVGSGSVVTKSLPSGVVAAGSPARVVRGRA